MGLINRPAKVGAGGITSYQAKVIAGFPKIIDQDLDADYNSIVTVVNGALENVNIRSTAAITYSKLSLTGGIVNADVNAAAAISGTKLANGTVDGAKLINATVDGAKLINATVDGAKLINATVNGAKLINATVDGAKLINATVDGAKLINATVNGAKLIDNSVLGAKLQDGTVDASTKIQDDTVVTAKLFPGAAVRTLTLANSLNYSVTNGEGAAATLPVFMSRGGVVMLLGALCANVLLNAGATGNYGVRLYRNANGAGFVLVNTWQWAAVNLQASALLVPMMWPTWLEATVNVTHVYEWRVFATNGSVGISGAVGTVFAAELA